MQNLYKNKAIENIKAAEILFENDCFNASANRAYYAAFHIAMAVLYQNGFQPKPDHRTVQILFTDNFFNRKKIISSRYKGYLSELQKKRNLADYLKGVSKREAIEQLRNAKELFDLVMELLK